MLVNAGRSGSRRLVHPFGAVAAALSADGNRCVEHRLGWDYQEAEIEFRRGGGRLDGMMGVTHYASMLYPAQALGDRELWPKLRDLLLEWIDSGENEQSLVPQWDACLRYDQRAQLLSVRVPVHVIAFAEDVQAPPQDGQELAALIPGATFHLLDGMGHGSWYGHAHERLNPIINNLLWRHFQPGASSTPSAAST
jgi:pimeloyl-ACP methyl ester carboxylesterase